MTWDIALDIILDALKDSALVFVFVFLIHVLISFFENQISNFLVKRERTGVVFGSMFGLIPQCGTSVLGADLYIKKYISIGTLSAIFLSCSDEAFIELLTAGNEKAIMILPLIGLKFSIGVIAGLLIDLVAKKKDIVHVDEIEEEHECHKHHHENTEMHKHLVHPLIHSLEVFAYVLVINLIIGFIIVFVGEDQFANFLNSSKYLTPLFASIVGLIPNCASSLLITKLFINGNLSFGALLSGLLVNSGLGFMILLRNKENAKKGLIVLSICFGIAVFCGYIACLIVGF